MGFTHGHHRVSCNKVFKYPCSGKFFYNEVYSECNVDQSQYNVQKLLLSEIKSVLHVLFKLEVTPCKAKQLLQGIEV